MRNGNQRSCGCKRRGPRDLIGQHFGWLLVLHPVSVPGRENRGKWVCLCDPAIGGCGAETVARAADMKRGRITSCKCRRARAERKNSLIGKTYGCLRVIERDRKSGPGHFVVLCDPNLEVEIWGGENGTHRGCGAIVTKGIAGLSGGSVRSCGCLLRRTRVELGTRSRVLADTMKQRANSAGVPSCQCEMPRAKPGDRLCKRCRRLWQQYRLIHEDVAAMHAKQGGLCAMCRSELPLELSCVDHDHTLSREAPREHRIRGLVHDWCNSAFGLLGEDPATIEGLLLYSRRFRGEGLRMPTTSSPGP